jgi:hypothetical protein
MSDTTPIDPSELVEPPTTPASTTVGRSADEAELSPSLAPETSSSAAAIAAAAFTSTFISLIPRFARTAIEALVSYVAVWMFALLLAILALLTPGQAAKNWAWAIEAPGQLIGMSIFGPLSVGTTLFGISASVSLFALPYLLTAAVAVATVILARRSERSIHTTTLAKWIISGITGLAFAVVALLVALFVPISSSSAIPTLGGLGIPPITVSASTGSAALFFGGLVIVTVSAFLARWSVSRRVRNGDSSVRADIRTRLGTNAPMAVLYAVIVGALLLVALVIAICVKGQPGSLLTAPLWLPTLVANGIPLVNLSSVTTTGSATTLLNSFGSFPSSIWLPSSTFPIWATCLAVVVNLVVVALIGIALRLRRGTPATGITWVATILTFAVLGLVISLLGSVSVWTHVDSSKAGAALNGLLGSSGAGGLGSFGSATMDAATSVQLTIGPAAWTFLIFAVLGGLVEASASFLAPAAIPIIPAGVVSGVSNFLGRFGAALTPATDGGLGTSAESVPLTPQAKRRLTIGLSVGGGAILLVILVAIAVSILNTSVFSPDRPVRAYLDDLVTGNAAHAIRDGGLSKSAATDAVLTKGMSSKTHGRVTSYSITGVTTSSETGEVTVTERQGGRSSSTTYTVQKSGTTALFFPNWKLSSVALPTLSVQVSNGVEALDVNGVTVSLSKSEKSAGEVDLRAFPGDYTVGLGGGSKWLTATSHSVSISAGGIGSTADASVEVRPSAALKTEVTNQIATFLAKCAAETTLNPPGCPLESFGFGTVSHVAWKITSVPPVTLTADGSKWDVTADTTGEATVSYDESDFGFSDHENETDDYYIGGTVSFSTGTPVFTYNDSF